MPSELLTVTRQGVETPDSLVTLAPEQEREFLAFMARPELQDVPRHKRLYRYLENRFLGFTYRGETYIATTAMEKSAGNCMSLALLTSALAKLADVEVSYQLVSASPVYKKQKDVLLLSYHVKTHLYDPDFVPDEDEWVFIRPKIVVDYFPDRGDVGGGKITTGQFLSMYYRNISTEYIVHSDLERAFVYAHKALELAPKDPENINLMALILKRKGYIDLARAWFEFGVEHSKTNVTLLSNYQLLMRQQGDLATVNTINEYLSMLDDPDPYAWIKAGYDAIQRENFRLAVHHFKKAIDKAPYLDDAYFGLAKSHFARGDLLEADRAMRMAVEKAFNEEDRILYKAKLKSLNSIFKPAPNERRAE